MKNKKLFAILTLVCFMFTLMPVAAFAVPADVAADTSTFMLNDGEETTVTTSDTIKFTFTAKNGAYDEQAEDGYIYVWAKDAKGNVTSALKVATTNAAVTAPQYVKAVAASSADAETEVEVQFLRGGDYTVYAAFTDATTVDKMADLYAVEGSGDDVINVVGENADPENYVFVSITPAATAGTADDDFDFEITTVKPNNVKDEYTLYFENNGKPLNNATVTIDTDSANIEANLVKSVTKNGKVTMELSAAREGEYRIYLDVDGAEFVIKVECTNTSAAYIETVTEPKAPLALFTTASDFNNVGKQGKVEFLITDINNNVVQSAYTDDGADNLYVGGTAQAKYLYFVEKPAKSTLTDSSLSLENTSANGKYTLQINKTLDAEGTYTVKAILDNGSVATATWEVKKFDKPVAIKIKSVADTVELGRVFTPELVYVDKNGVEKDADDAVLVATGYAIKTFNEATDTITVESNERYAGSVIKLTAISERYDLVAPVKEVKVAAEATEIAFADANLEVNVNNKVKWNVVDADGNKVTLTDTAAVIKYAVLDKPEGAKVSVYDATTGTFAGEGTMGITSNMVGNVTVQVIVQVDLQGTTEKAKYYTGVVTLPIGMDTAKDVVVMSIGSDQLVKNNEIIEIQTAPVVKESRTFVPFRALLNAFGIDVEWDAATQSVTAVKEGTTVVLTIGSNVLTVNGAEVTTDVAPYLTADGWTMVPVRVITEAFGYDVEYTKDANGAVADVLFF